MPNNLLTVAPGVWIDPTVRKDLHPDQAYVLLDAAGLASLGLSAAQDKMLRRLEHAGMLTIYAITPRRRLLQLASWQKHLQAVTEDPEYWEKTENRRRWRLAIQCT